MCIPEFKFEEIVPQLLTSLDDDDFDDDDDEDDDATVTSSGVNWWELDTSDGSTSSDDDDESTSSSSSSSDDNYDGYAVTNMSDIFGGGSSSGSCSDNAGNCSNSESCGDSSDDSIIEENANSSSSEDDERIYASWLPTKKRRPTNSLYELLEEGQLERIDAYSPILVMDSMSSVHLNILERGYADSSDDFDVKKSTYTVINEIRPPTSMRYASGARGL